MSAAQRTADVAMQPEIGRIVRLDTGAGSAKTLGSVIVGGGPAGLAPLIAASQAGFLDRVLAGGLAIVESGAVIGAGGIGRYAISSDSSAATIASCVRAGQAPWLVALHDHPATCAVASYGDGAVPLALVGRFLAVVGAALHAELAQAADCSVLTGHQALYTRQVEGGLWRTVVRRGVDGARASMISRQVVLATGGHQPEARLRHHAVAGVPLFAQYGAKIMQSGEALTAAGLAAITQRLEGSGARHVAIVGSSSSAIACAHALLQLPHGVHHGVRQVSVLHRRPLRVFYPSAEAALDDGYDEFGPDDICPVSGFVFRFAGFRLHSRNLVMAARGIGGRAAPDRLHLHRVAMDRPDPKAQAILENADVIVAALGYRPRALEVQDQSGRVIALHADGPGAPAMVDGACQVLDGRGAPIPGLLGVGLAAGFPSGASAGGEPSFSGQTNGLWQWQNTIGAIISEHVRVAANGVGRDRVSSGLTPS